MVKIQTRRMVFAADFATERFFIPAKPTFNSYFSIPHIRNMFGFVRLIPASFIFALVSSILFDVFEWHKIIISLAGLIIKSAVIKPF